MQLMKPVSGLFFLCAILLSSVSCKKKFNDEIVDTETTTNRNARIAAVPNYLTEKSSLNFYDVLALYCGIKGRSGLPDPAATQIGHTFLTEAATNGFKVIRFFAAGAYSETKADNTYPVVLLWKNNPTAFYQAFDNLVADANSLGIQLVPSLVTGLSDWDELQSAVAAGGDQGKLLGQITFMESLKVRVNGVDQTLDCINNPTACKNRTEMRQFALDIVNRYKNSNTILYWEIGNELQNRPDDVNLTATQLHDYIASLAAEIKAIDNTHMLAAGIIYDNGSMVAADGRFYTYYANNPNIDIASIHLYEPPSLQYPSDPVSSFITGPPYEVLQHVKQLAGGLGKTLVIAEAGVPEGRGWIYNQFSDYVMSLLLAKTYLKIPMAMAWNWQSKTNGYYIEDDPATPDNELVHAEMQKYSLDPGEDDDAISVLRLPTYNMGNNNIQTAVPITGDFNNDGYDDFGVKTVRGLWQLSFVKNYTPEIPVQWFSQFGDDNVDPGGAVFQPLTGDWNGDGRTDIGLKSKDGRWFTAFYDQVLDRFGAGFQWLSNFGNEYNDPGGAPFTALTGDWNGDHFTDIGIKTKDGRWFMSINNQSGGFINQAQWLSNFGNEYSDPGGAPFYTLTGDWNGDGKTDIGLKTRDGRWFIAYSNGNGFNNLAQWLTGFGNDYTDAGGAPFLPVTGDWDRDGKTDIGMKSNDGRWFTAISDPVAGQFNGLTQRLTDFGNNYTDPAANPSVPFTGDWDNDGHTDIGLKTKDGRWFIARTSGNSFIGQKQCFIE